MNLTPQNWLHANGGCLNGIVCDVLFQFITIFQFKKNAIIQNLGNMIFFFRFAIFYIFSANVSQPSLDRFAPIYIKEIDF